MASFIYITDVFCPWCYGFAPVLRRLVSEFGFPVRVLCGNLVDEPVSSEHMGDPRGLAFFKRLGETTGRPVGEDFYSILQPGAGVIMDSQKSARLMAALKKLAPGKSLEQMEAFQNAFYGEGADVLSPDVQGVIAGRWNVDPDALSLLQATSELARIAAKGMNEAEDMLGDFVVYPTLFLRDDSGELHPVARGYAPFETVMSKIQGVLGAGDVSDAAPSRNACGMDGSCCPRGNQ